MAKKKALLCILDGFALGEPGPQNAIDQAQTPTLDKLFKSCPHSSLAANGKAVGLPEGQMGNSEVGHLNIGAGQVVYQELSRIDKACQDGELEKNEVLCSHFEALKHSKKALHLMGLYSDGGVHSSLEHAQALAKMAASCGVSRIYIHAFLDGRDVDPYSGLAFIESLQEFLAQLEKNQAQLHGDQNLNAFKAQIASLSGRYYAMDRDKRWDRVQKAYESLMFANNQQTISPQEYIKSSYEQGISDEFIIPAAFNYTGMQDGDLAVFFNFRPDRARELSSALSQDDFNAFDRASHARLSGLICLTEYDPSLKLPVAFPKQFPKQVLADVLSQAGLRQFHTAETEKYAHVTFFFNGGKEEPKVGEERLLIHSPKVATYDLKPEMSAYELTDSLIKAIEDDKAEVYIVNFANCDMVGHTGVLEAAIKAVEAVDLCLGKLVDACRAHDIEMLISADHGNADLMYKVIDGEKKAFTAHTTNRVPIIYVGSQELGFASWVEREGRLCDIAPSLLYLLGLAAPDIWEGRSLFALK